MMIVITMAGLGSRFRKAGYTVPKYEIMVNNHSLFYWSMLSLQDINSKEYCFIVREEDHSEKFILKECEKLGINANIIQIKQLTRGQAETAMIAKEKWEKNEPLFIYNIDTYVEQGLINDNQFKGDGFIPCFEASGTHWSFAKLGEDGSVIEVKEKERISNNCSIGAYYFKTTDLFESLYNEFYIERNSILEGGERYIAPLYNYLIKEKKGQVYISKIPSKYVHVLGTPEEVELFRSGN